MGPTAEEANAPLEILFATRALALDLVRLGKTLANVAVAVADAAMVKSLRRGNQLLSNCYCTREMYLTTKEAKLFACLARTPELKVVAVGVREVELACERSLASAGLFASLESGENRTHT